MTSQTYEPKDGLPTSAPVKSRRLGRALLLSALGTALGVAAAAYGYDWWTSGRFIESTDDAYVGGDVTVIAPKVSGFIAQVAVTDNQAVHAGDLLLTLDDRDYRAALARAVAAVQAQQATLANLEAQRRLQQAVINQAAAGVGAAKAETDRAKYDQDRYRALSATAAASIQAFEKADAAYKQAVANGEKATATLQAAERQIDVIDTQKRQAEAALAGAIADRDTAQLNLSYTELRSPIDGTVGNRSARPGAYATVGAQLIAIVPARGLWVDANFKESQIAGLKAGQPVSVVADVLPGREFRGHVASLAPATGAQFSVLPPENATGNFTKIVQRVPVRILLEGEGGLLGSLRPGLSVTAAINTKDGAGSRGKAVAAAGKTVP
ncbi:HlyD family secretion protein [Nitrospirillum pindoramense]|uniref:Membrane fusion protein (Multidrug efflux system) n=1 Tax=Nitrospirillum amazonense TaxID=28077 RepID=A0A560HI13_9PROT|nr:HlyD family secretion protein [Nitrospirillum amazonense]TWB46085.1 membrane fusion protein (multidrug efflux system) [Nitrospirillum amazonense]